MRIEPEELVVWCDGGCETEDGAPVARYAYVVLRGREEVAAGAGEVGRGREMTANVAEYAAVLHALEQLARAGRAGATRGEGVNMISPQQLLGTVVDGRYRLARPRRMGPAGPLLDRRALPRVHYLQCPLPRSTPSPRAL